MRPPATHPGAQSTAWQGTRDWALSGGGTVFWKDL